MWQKQKESRVVGNKFLPLHRLYKPPDYNYSKIKLDNSFLKQDFLKILTTYLDGYFVFQPKLLTLISVCVCVCVCVCMCVCVHVCVSGGGNLTPSPLLVVLLKFRNSKRCNPGISQHEVKFH